MPAAVYKLPLPTWRTEHSPLDCCYVLTASLAAGKYSEHAFQALDYLLDEASKYGIRLLLSLGNNWDHADSKAVVSCPLKLFAHVGWSYRAAVQLCTGMPVSACSKPGASSCPWLAGAVFSCQLAVLLCCCCAPPAAVRLLSAVFLWTCLPAHAHLCVLPRLQSTLPCSMSSGQVPRALTPSSLTRRRASCSRTT